MENMNKLNFNTLSLCVLLGAMLVGVAAFSHMMKERDREWKR